MSETVTHDTLEVDKSAAAIEAQMHKDRGLKIGQAALQNTNNPRTAAFVERLSSRSPLGTGAEKAVYELGHDKAVAIYDRPQSPEEIKNEFYRRKLAHLLLPENTPDIHLA